MNSSLSDITAAASSPAQENTENKDDNSVSIASASTTVRSVYDYDGSQKAFSIKNLGKKAYVVAALSVAAIALIVCTVFLVGQPSYTYADEEKENIPVTNTNTNTNTEIQNTVSEEKSGAVRFTKTSYKVPVGGNITASYGYVSSDSKKQTGSEYNVTYSSNNVRIAIVNQMGQVSGISAGTTSINVVSQNGTYDTVPVTVTPLKSNKIKNVPFIYQGEKYPSGCESVSSVMLLNYYGFNIKVETFIDKYLEKGYLKFDKNGEMYGPDFYSAFLGNPYSGDALGCYPPVIEKAMNKYLSDKGYRAVDLTGTSMDYLVNRYITNNKPVVIWATMYMANPVQTYTWRVKGADKNSPYKDGDTCEWLANEHCMLLVGYDKDYYYLHDPLASKYTAYEKKIFEERFAQMGRCAVVIDKII